MEKDKDRKKCMYIGGSLEEECVGLAFDCGGENLPCVEVQADRLLFLVRFVFIEKTENRFFSIETSVLRQRLRYG